MILKELRNLLLNLFKMFTHVVRTLLNWFSCNFRSLSLVTVCMCIVKVKLLVVCLGCDFRVDLLCVFCLSSFILVTTNRLLFSLTWILVVHMRNSRMTFKLIFVIFVNKIWTSVTFKICYGTEIRDCELIFPVLHLQF